MKSVYKKLLAGFACIIFILGLVLYTNTATSQEIRIVQFSDVHLDTKNPDRTVRKFAQSLPMFRKAIQKVNKINPDIVVFSGDMVNKPLESEFDIFLDTANSLNQKYYLALGNHDVGVNGGLSKKIIIDKINQNCPWLKLRSTNYFAVSGEYLFVFMDGTNDKQITSKGTFSDDSLKFLDMTLSMYPYKKVIIVQHFPLMPPFASPSHEITNRDEYFDVINKYNNVIMVLSGHYHASKAVVKNNVLYITTPSMIEYPHAFRYIKVNSDKKYITITSKIYMDLEQNDKENTTNAVSRLKLGLPGDNDFSIQLKNNVPVEPIWTFSEKIFNK